MSMEVIDLITALWLGFIGACVGSFLNVVAYRVPLGMSVVWKPSHCPRCGRPIRPYDNVPIFGWLWLGGKCRDCQASISPRYAIVETVMGAVAFLLAYVELFSGGSNLPGGPYLDAPGAMHSVWVPYWPLLATYAVHLLLMAALTVLVLFDLDDVAAPVQFIGATLVAVTIICLLVPGANPWIDAGSAARAGNENPSRTMAVTIAAPLVLLTMFLIARRAPIMRSGNQAPQLHRRLINLVAAFVIVAASLGLDALQTTAPLAVLLVAISSAAATVRRRQIVSHAAAIWIATLVQIVFWQQFAAVWQ